MDDSIRKEGADELIFDFNSPRLSSADPSSIRFPHVGFKEMDDPLDESEFSSWPFDVDVRRAAALLIPVLSLMEDTDSNTDCPFVHVDDFCCSSSAKT